MYHAKQSNGIINIANIKYKLLTIIATLVFCGPTMAVPPVAVDDFGSTPENTTLTVTSITNSLMANDSDLDGDIIMITQFIIAGVAGIHNLGDTVVIPGVGTLQIYGPGYFQFVPLTNFVGTVPTATYTISAGADTATADLIITVTANPATAVPLFSSFGLFAMIAGFLALGRRKLFASLR